MVHNLSQKLYVQSFMQANTCMCFTPQNKQIRLATSHDRGLRGKYMICFVPHLFQGRHDHHRRSVSVSVAKVCGEEDQNERTLYIVHPNAVMFVFTISSCPCFYMFLHVFTYFYLFLHVFTCFYLFLHVYTFFYMFLLCSCGSVHKK